MPQGALETEPALAGGHGEQKTRRRKFGDQLGNAIEQLQFVIVRQVVVAVAFDHFRVALLGQFRYGVRRASCRPRPITCRARSSAGCGKPRSLQAH
jgi:hypothetical protein